MSEPDTTAPCGCSARSSCAPRARGRGTMAVVEVSHVESAPGASAASLPGLLSPITPTSPRDLTCVCVKSGSVDDPGSVSGKKTTRSTPSAGTGSSGSYRNPLARWNWNGNRRVSVGAAANPRTPVSDSLIPGPEALLQAATNQGVQLRLHTLGHEVLDRASRENTLSEYGGCASITEQRGVDEGILRVGMHVD